MFKKLGKGISKFMTKTFVGRLADNIVLGGAINNIKEDTITHKEGKINTKELILQVVSSVLPVLLVIALIKGWLTIEQIKDLVKILIP